MWVTVHKFWTLLIPWSWIVPLWKQKGHIEGIPWLHKEKTHRALACLLLVVYISHWHGWFTADSFCYMIPTHPDKILQSLMHCMELFHSLSLYKQLYHSFYTITSLCWVLNVLCIPAFTLRNIHFNIFDINLHLSMTVKNACHANKLHFLSHLWRFMDSWE